MQPSTIHVVDCNYVSPALACSYIVEEQGKVAIVENNTSHAVPIILDKVKQLGYSLDDVKYAIITHVHLDHAGGSSKLLGACKNATLLAHPKAAKHIIKPDVLIASAESVYGKENFQKLYGEISPVPESRVRIMTDGEELEFGERTFHFFYTKGHANHHFCIYDSKEKTVFTGDTYGISYPFFKTEKPFLFPTTTPTDFDAEEALLSIEKIHETKASTACLTHFGKIEITEFTKNSMKTGILEMKKLVDSGILIPDEKLEEFLRDGIREYFENKAKEEGVVLTPKAWDFLKMDVELNLMGLKYAIQKKKKNL